MPTRIARWYCAFSLICAIHAELRRDFPAVLPVMPYWRFFQRITQLLPAAALVCHSRFALECHALALLLSTTIAKGLSGGHLPKPGFPRAWCFSRSDVDIAGLAALPGVILTFTLQLAGLAMMDKGNSLIRPSLGMIDARCCARCSLPTGSQPAQGADIVVIGVIK